MGSKEDLKERLGKSDAGFDDSKAKNANKKYWVGAFGEVKDLDDFYYNNIFAIGWDALNDLKEYTNIDAQAIKDSIEKALKEKYPGGGKRRPTNDALTCYSFAHDVSKGDVVFLKKGRKKLLGRGIISSDYYYDKKRDSKKHVRKIGWKQKGEWPTNCTLPIKTLTDITKDTDLIKYLEGLMNGPPVTPTTNGDSKGEDQLIELLTKKKQIILYGPPGTGKTYNTKKIAVDLLGRE